MYDSKKVTKSDCPFFGFYIHIWSLRDMGIVKENGLNSNNQKIWLLTDKGNQIAKRFKEIEEMML
jgi:predicted transcriptional regulator